MTADTLTTTDPRWDDVRTFEAIAAGPDWPETVRAYWETVSRVAHDQSHTVPIHGCPGCPQGSTCPRCGLPVPECKDPAGHDRVWREGETSLLVGVGRYGRSSR